MMPGIKEDMKFNKIRKKKATVHLERVMLCDKKTNACGVSVARRSNLYVGLDCPSGPCGCARPRRASQEEPEQALDQKKAELA